MIALFPGIACSPPSPQRNQSLILLPDPCRHVRLVWVAGPDGGDGAIWILREPKADEFLQGEDFDEAVLIYVCLCGQALGAAV